MAGRGRPRKKNGRLDMAVQAMSSFGFSEELICKTVKELLQVYGGEKGWRFIEEQGYLLLIETILEKQQKPKTNEGEEPGAGPSNAVPSPPSLNLESGNAVAALPHEPSEGSEGETSATEPPTAAPSPAREPVGLIDSSSPTKEMLEPMSDNAPANNSEEELTAATKTKEEGNTSEPAILSLPSVQNDQGRPRRRRFHGWIGDENDKEEFIKLEPIHWIAQLAEALYNAPEKKRRNRWDVKPDDPSE